MQSRARRRLGPALLLALAALPAAAETSGADLLRMARAYVEVNSGRAAPSHRSGFFSGFVRAVYERGNGRSFCGPPCACESDEAVVAYLEAHPGDLERAAHELVENALAARFPCTR